MSSDFYLLYVEIMGFGMGIKTWVRRVESGERRAKSEEARVKRK